MKRVEGNYFDVLVRSKETGKLIRTECDAYENMGNLKRYLQKFADKIEIVIVDPAYASFLPWDRFSSALESVSKSGK